MIVLDQRAPQLLDGRQISIRHINKKLTFRKNIYIFFRVSV